jgi:hypothetical protein
MAIMLSYFARSVKRRASHTRTDGKSIKTVILSMSEGSVYVDGRRFLARRAPPLRMTNRTDVTK